MSKNQSLKKPGLVSVVVASYNHAKFLSERMESLINQTYKDIEILIIDDCSTDDSRKILSKYKKYKNVKIIMREENGGWVVTFNQGIENTSGEFIIFANTDDTCEPNMIENLLKGFNQNPSVGISYCRSQMIDENNKLLGDDFAGRSRSFRKRCSQSTLLKKDEMSRFLLDSCVMPNMSAVLIRRECFDLTGKFTGAYQVCSDWNFYFQVVSKYDVSYSIEPLNKFRMHPTSAVAVMTNRALYEEYFRLLFGQIRALDLHFIERIVFRIHIITLWGKSLITHPWNGLRNFIYHLKKIFQYDPPSLFFIPIGFILSAFEIIKIIIRKVLKKGFARQPGLVADK